MLWLKIFVIVLQMYGEDGGLLDDGRKVIPSENMINRNNAGRWGEKIR